MVKAELVCGPLNVAVACLMSVKSTFSVQISRTMNCSTVYVDYVGLSWKTPMNFFVTLFMWTLMQLYLCIMASRRKCD